MEQLIKPLIERKTTETSEDREIASQHKNIPGWGMDADPKNDPTYPIKRHTDADHQRINYEKAPQQPENIEVLRSNERPTITRVFGTAVPPAGLSGVIRRRAFKYSESDARHWMMLLLADRINVIEGIIDDFRKGTVPNIWVEKGWSAEWKTNRPAMIRKLTAATVVAGILIVLLARNTNFFSKRTVKRLAKLSAM